MFYYRNPIIVTVLHNTILQYHYKDEWELLFDHKDDKNPP